MRKLNIIYLSSLSERRPLKILDREKGRWKGERKILHGLYIYTSLSIFIYIFLLQVIQLFNIQLAMIPQFKFYEKGLDGLMSEGGGGEGEIQGLSIWYSYVHM